MYTQATSTRHTETLKTELLVDWIGEREGGMRVGGWVFGWRHGRVGLASPPHAHTHTHRYETRSAKKPPRMGPMQ